MSRRPMSAVDAQMYWMSAKIPNDTVLVYGFAGVPADMGKAVGEVAECARGCPDLTVRIGGGRGLRYPAWTTCGVDESQLVVHDLDDRSWVGCLAAVHEVSAEPLDARRHAWRLHVFGGVEDVPGAGGVGTVAVLQISHALGGGGRMEAPAAVMFGRVGGGDIRGIDFAPPSPFSAPVLGVRAARAHRQLVADTAQGRVPAPAELRPVLRTNARPAGRRQLRTVTCRRADLRGPTVTVAVLSAVSVALAGQLRELDEDPSLLGAEVPMAKAPPRPAYNHFGNVGVGLHPELDEPERGLRIAADLAARRARAAHPAMLAADLAFAATPAPLLRWGMDKFDPDARVDMVTGNTVVSSVNFGAADFGFGGGPVTMASAFAELSPMMGLTHVVGGVGGAITVGVTAAESAIGDVDAYVERLRAALG